MPGKVHPVEVRALYHAGARRAARVATGDKRGQPLYRRRIAPGTRAGGPDSGALAMIARPALQAARGGGTSAWSSPRAPWRLERPAPGPSAGVWGRLWALEVALGRLSAHSDPLRRVLASSARRLYLGQFLPESHCYFDPATEDRT